MKIVDNYSLNEENSLVYLRSMLNNEAVIDLGIGKFITIEELVHIHSNILLKTVWFLEFILKIIDECRITGFLLFLSENKSDKFLDFLFLSYLYIFKALYKSSFLFLMNYGHILPAYKVELLRDLMFNLRFNFGIILCKLYSNKITLLEGANILITLFEEGMIKHHNILKLPYEKSLPDEEVKLMLKTSYIMPYFYSSFYYMFYNFVYPHLNEYSILPLSYEPDLFGPNRVIDIKNNYTYCIIDYDYEKCKNYNYIPKKPSGRDLKFYYYYYRYCYGNKKR